MKPPGAAMTGPFAARLFRLVFVAAGVYNLAFGLWAGLWPLHFFSLFDIPSPRYPAIWSCLGMVVGVYGLLYLNAAWKLAEAWPIIAVGLLGKMLGPIGMLLTIGDDWPRRLAMLCVYNDIIWWLPFCLFLLRGTRLAGQIVRLAPYICAVLHAVAFLAMPFALQHGTLAEAEASNRATFLAEHPTLWTMGWLVWMISAMSLVGFFAWWGGRLSATWAAIGGVLLAAMGMVFDLSGESLSVLVLVEQARPVIADSAQQAWDRVGFEILEDRILLLTAGAANLLYTLGGIVLTLKTPNLPTVVRAAMWATWLAGLGMTVAALARYVPGMVATTVILFPLLIGWTWWMGWQGRPTCDE